MKKIIYTSLVVTVSAILVVGAAWGGSPSGKGGIPARVEALEAQVEELEAAVEALQAAFAVVQANPILDLREYMSVDKINGLDGAHIILKRVNLQIVNGEGGTDTVNGLGNLIVGYNEEPEGLVENDRGGSHNLVMGAQNRL